MHRAPLYEPSANHVRRDPILIGRSRTLMGEALCWSAAGSSCTPHRTPADDSLKVHQLRFDAVREALLQIGLLSDNRQAPSRFANSAKTLSPLTLQIL